MMMEQNAKRVGRQAPEQPEPGNDDGTKPVLGRIENPIQLQSCLGKKGKDNRKRKSQRGKGKPNQTETYQSN